MDFYQQKYFQPYRKVNRDPVPAKSSQYFDRSYPNQSHYYDSPNRQNNTTNYPTFERSPIKGPTHTRMTTEPIWQYLYNEGKKSKDEIMSRHEHQKNKIDLQCTFQPVIKSNKRYMVHSSSNFIERNALWNENKIEKKVKEKEEKVYDDLKECTFTPKTNPRNKKHSQFNASRQLNRDRSQRMLKEKNRNVNPYYSPIRDNGRGNGRASVSPIKEKTQRSNIETVNVHRLIKNELRRLNV